MYTPPTPIHPRPNEEVRYVPDGQLPVAADLELNPDLYEDSEGDSSHHGHGHAREHGPVTVAEELEEEVAMGEAPLFTLPFDTALEICQQDFAKVSSTAKTLSLAQQSLLINYTDEQLLGVQRRFIRSLVSDEGGEPYPTMTLLRDLSRIVDVLWQSVNTKNALFGQQSYLIKILGDLEEYVAKLDVFEAPQDVSEGGFEASLMELFVVLQLLDVRCLFLYDGYEVHTEASSTTRLQKLSSTDVVRITPIATRLRAILADRLEALRRGLRLDKSKDARALLNILEVEVGKLFEGLMDRV